MPFYPELQQLALGFIAHRCAEESERFYRKVDSDSRYCFEMFRRAFEDRSQQAWELIYKQYHALIGRWVMRHPSYKLCDEEIQYFINRALERIWTAVQPENFKRFTSLKSVLQYLQMCVGSAIMDHLRHKEQQTIFESIDLSPIHKSNNPGNIETIVLDRTRQIELWESIEARLNNENERTVIYATYVLGWKPRQIFVAYPNIFANPGKVSRIKENVLARFKRDQALMRLLIDA